MRLESAPRFIAAIIIFLLCLGLIVFGIVQLTHNDQSTNTATNQEQSGQSSQQQKQHESPPNQAPSESNKSGSAPTTSQTNGSSSGAPGSSTQSSSSPASSGTSGESGTNASKGLSNSGPGDVIAIFAVVTALGTLAAHAYQTTVKKS